MPLRTDYYSYNPESGCSQKASLTSAILTVRGGSPMMAADMLRLTGEDTLPTITFPMMPMSYPDLGTDASLPEFQELLVSWKHLHTYMGSKLNFTDFTAYPTYGAEQGMVLAVATKVLEMASTTCNRNFYAFLQAPAYGYDWDQAVAWVDANTDSFYAGAECTCAVDSSCKKKGKVTISQRGWAPQQLPALPSAASDNGTMYTPASTDPKSPWFQTNVIPGNPIGRFGPCVTPREKCLCDGVYWYPGFVAPGKELSDIKCYSWAFSITKIYSARMRAGIMMIMDKPAAVRAASGTVDTALSIANGLYSHMQTHGQVQLIQKLMEKPFSDPTSWLHAMAKAQYEKWDAIYDAFSVCQAAGVTKITAEQSKYFGAYVFSSMMPDYQGLSVNIGGSTSDFFKSVVGFDHYNYNWGWRGEKPVNYGNGVTSVITVQDFNRIHLFRALEVYQEEARRMKKVCSDFNARATPTTLTLNEWKALRMADKGRRRRLSDEPVSEHARALEVQVAAPKMLLIDALKYAMETDPHRKLSWEYGMPADMKFVE